MTFRFPRPCRRLIDSFRFTNLAGEFSVGQGLARDLRDNRTKAVGVVHLVSIVVAKRLLVDVAEQVERFDRNVGAMKAALQQRPKILNGVGVSVAVHILDRVIDDGVLIVGVQTFIRFQFVAEDRRASSTSGERSLAIRIWCAALRR